MATHYEQILENVRSKLLLMGQLSIDSLRLSLQALIDKDAELAGKVRSKDKESASHHLHDLLRQQSEIAFRISLGAHGAKHSL